MSHRQRVFAELALTMAFLGPVAGAQKPPSPKPTPSAPPSSSTPLPSSTSQPIQSDDLVTFLRGRVATGDGSPIPHDLMVERVCNLGLRQQVYASPNGYFSMQLASRNDFMVDASGGSVWTSPSGVTPKDSSMGISRHELTSCELRTSTSGFRSDPRSLVDIDILNGSVDVGVLVVQRISKIEGITLSANSYNAPKEARRAYEKGQEAAKNGKLANARRCFETAVEIYPRFANAWFELGGILEKENQKDAAREAYTRAANIDYKFLLPYLSLASMAYEAGSWTEVLNLTAHILDLDPWNRSNSTGYVVDFDAVNSTDVYFYNVVANYNLNKIDEAEKSGLRAEHYLNVGTRFPQLHLLMAAIFTRKNNYSNAISELQTFLALVPHAKEAGPAREQLAELQKLNGILPTKQ